MTYQPRNRRLALTEGFIAKGVTWFVDDADDPTRPALTASDYGCEELPVRVVHYHGTNFVIADNRGRFLKNEKCWGREGRRRVRLFKSAEGAAAFALENQLQDCGA